MRTIRRLLWKLYKGFCFFIGTSVLIFSILLVIMNVAKRFDTYKLPNGTYISRLNFFSDPNDSSLWLPDGTLMHNGPLWNICFNENYVHGNPENGPDFIYPSKNGGVIFETDLGYGETYEISELFASNEPECNGSFGTGRRFGRAISPGLLLLYPGRTEEEEIEWLYREENNCLCSWK